MAHLWWFGVGVLYWVFGVGVFSWWGLGPVVWGILGFLGWGSLYKHKRITLETKMVRERQHSLHAWHTHMSSYSQFCSISPRLKTDCRRPSSSCIRRLAFYWHQIKNFACKSDDYQSFYLINLFFCKLQYLFWRSSTLPHNYIVLTLQFSLAFQNKLLASQYSPDTGIKFSFVWKELYLTPHWI